MDGQNTLLLDGTDEDGATASFAGQHEINLNIVGADAIIQAVTRCWELARSEHALDYRRRQGRVGILMDQAFSMIDVMTLIPIVVGSLGVINTLTMSVIERTREIGMLRAIVTTRGQIVRMVLAEAGLMGVIGGILGLATGVIRARILFIGMTTMSGYELTFTLPPDALVISLIVALIVSQLAAIPPALRAARVRIIEALQYE